MAGKIVADTLEHSTAGSIATNYVVKGSAKAFLYFDSSIATPVADASFNISSILDGTTGIYDPNFTNSMGSADYSVTSGISPESGTGDQAFSHPNSASQYSFNIYSGTGSYDDNAHCSSSVFGDLA
tara:strand:- start:62 stop:439 length:378 start_codon:yes stop_codon:yes gene_type:complete